jgi:hypothetical protein
MAALLAVFLACFREYRARLAPGERAVVMILATDRAQAGVVFGYVRGLLEHPLLRPLVEAERAESIDLRGGVSIEVHASSYRSVRGRTLAAAILDEVAFWRDETTSNPDAEVVAALRPALATTGGLLLGISSPYARRGVLWTQFNRHFGKDGSPVLVWRADSRTMNPELPAELVEGALAEDEAAARSEWLAEFRADLESFADREAVERCVVPSRSELPRRTGVTYFAFADPSGGKADSFTLAIAHREKDAAVVDALRERRPPFNPDDVVREYAQLARAYGVSKVVGDRYAGAWVEERFRAHGLRFGASALSKSDLYVHLLGPLNAGRIELPDAPALVGQLVALERRTARATGRDTVDHPPGGRDDLANAVAGAVHLVLAKPVVTYGGFDLREAICGPSDPFLRRWWEWERRQEGGT